MIHYHANIHKALKYAVKIDLIPTNPADKVERPKKNEFKGSYYSADEIHALTEVAEGTKLEIPVLLASFYGLRRSEVLGLKWDAIDFEANTLEIKHIVTQASIDGKKVLVQADRAKTKSSLRTLPLVPPIRDRLLMLKGQQDTYRRLCGKSYNRDYLGYLCVDEIGNIIRPNYVSEQFPKLLEKNGLRPIRFHDLRHNCASLLLANGVPMKQIQEWLGHSDFSTTANIYAHLDYASKLSSAHVFKIRIPSFAKRLIVNGEKTTAEELTFEIAAGEHREIVLSYDMVPYFEERPHELQTVKCGSLVFSVPISYAKEKLEYERDGVERKFPYCDYEYIPLSSWNYAYCDKSLQKEQRGISDIPFSSEHPPVVIKAKVKEIAWGFEDGYETVCAKIPESREAISEKKEILLYPYGCAKLRMTEIPLIEQ